MRTYKMVLFMFFCLAIVFFIFVKSDIFFSETPSYSRLIIGKTMLTVELADEPKERAHGLGGRMDLEEGKGMLFLFENYSRPIFWMKNMKFPIDIIWIRDDKIIGFEESVPFSKDDKNLLRYAPSEEVNRVLEVQAGFVQKHKIKIGTKVEYPGIYY